MLGKANFDAIRLNVDAVKAKVLESSNNGRLIPITAGVLLGTFNHYEKKYYASQEEAKDSSQKAQSLMDIYEPHKA